MLKLEDFKVGMSAKLTRAFSAQDVETFAALTGDDNPVHLNEDFARESMFGQRIVHGALASSMFSNLFGAELPGHGSIYLKNEVTFLKPIFLDQAIEYSVEIVEIVEAKRRLIFQTRAQADGVDYIVGTAQMYIPK